MPRLVLDLPQEVLDALNAIALEAKEPAFKTQDAKGMLEYRLAREARERRISRATEVARLREEDIP